MVSWDAVTAAVNHNPREAGAVSSPKNSIIWFNTCGPTKILLDKFRCLRQLGSFVARRSREREREGWFSTWVSPRLFLLRHKFIHTRKFVPIPTMNHGWVSIQSHRLNNRHQRHETKHELRTVVPMTRRKIFCCCCSWFWLFWILVSGTDSIPLATW